VAIGSVLTTHPQALVLDEPTSALDPGAAEEVLAALQRLVYDLGLTVVLAEHRLERVIQYVDTVAVVGGDGTLAVSDPADAMADSPVAPPVVQLGRLAGWTPLAMSVRDARRKAGPLRRRLDEAPTPPRRSVPAGAEPVLECRGLSVSYGPVMALHGADLTVRQGEVMALMGRNGAGKSTLQRTIVGLATPQAGSARVAGVSAAGLRGRELLRRVAFVPQEPSDMLYADSVAAECAAADRDAGAPPGRTAGLLSELAPRVRPETHPRDLSEGTRLLLVLAIVLASDPPLLLLDEPTRGLDYAAKDRLVGILRRRAEDGTAVLLTTHDVEMVAEVADTVAIMAEGEVVASGPTSEIVTASPLFAPQVAKILAPEPWLTVEEVRRALESVVS
jgi:energy-coupling factor transport system ATP-binding protein